MRRRNGQVVHITRRGKPVAVLVSEDAYERLESAGPNRDFWQAIEDWRAQAGFDWPELTSDEVDDWRDRRPEPRVLVGRLSYLLDGNVLFVQFVDLKDPNWFFVTNCRSPCPMLPARSRVSMLPSGE